MSIEQQLKNKIDNLSKPIGSLGLLEDIALQIGSIQQTLTPELNRPAMLVFAADHGLVQEGVSSCPKEITWQQCLNFKAGGAGISVFTRQHNFELKVIDAGVDYDFPDDAPVVNAKIAYGSGNMLYEPAMTIEQCTLAMSKGAYFVQEEAKAGTNVIGFGEMGIGNTSPSSLLMHKFSGFPIADCIGPGAGHTPEGLEHKHKILSQVLAKHSTDTPLETLATFGGLEIAMMVGAFIEAKRQNMVILVDGFIATAALITALEFDSSVKANCIFCHTSHEPGYKLMLEHLDVTPVLNLNLRLGEGTGAALAYPIIQSALIMLNQMTSFNEAGVAAPEELQDA